jgi:hypothetical protein
MKTIVKRFLHIDLHENQSAFLWVRRKTGKTTQTSKGKRGVQ